MVTDDVSSVANGISTKGIFIKSVGTVGIGTANPQYLLSVNGALGTKDVIVTNTGWSDYVFRPGYRLRPLSEVGAYIQAHHHLPDIPSEAEVKEKGVSVGEMQAKIEELTLHLIQQDRENRELRERVAQLEARAVRSSKPAAGRILALVSPPLVASGRLGTAMRRSVGSRNYREEHSQVERGKTE